MQWASEEMKLDREIIGVATGVKAEALQGASDEKIRTMVSLRTGEKELRSLSEEMKGDRELCTAAVAQNGRGRGVPRRVLEADRFTGKRPARPRR